MNGRAKETKPNVMEDHILKERFKQVILQSIPFRENVRIHSILAIEVDNGPQRCIILNDSLSNEDRIRLWAQALPLAASSLLGLDPKSLSFNGHAQTENHTTEQHNASSSPTQSNSNVPTAAPSKRKRIRPTKIPQSDSPLNLVTTGQEPAEDQTIASQTLRNILNNARVLTAQSEQPTFGDLSPPKMEHDGQEGNGNRFFQGTIPVFPMAKISYDAPSHTTPKKRSIAPLPGIKRPSSSKVFACNQCKEQFNSLNLLCKHTFSKHRAFRCTFCGANFTQRSNLQRHSLKHVGFKPFICNVCDKAYYRKDHLVRHIEVTHPEHDPRNSITVKLTSSECLEYLEKMTAENGIAPDGELKDTQASSTGPGEGFSLKEELNDIPEDVSNVCTPLEADGDMDSSNVCTPLGLDSGVAVFNVGTPPDVDANVEDSEACTPLPMNGDASNGVSEACTTLPMDGKASNVGDSETCTPLPMDGEASNVGDGFNGPAVDSIEGRVEACL